MVVIHAQGERRSTASLVPYAQNSRLHSEAQIEQIVESMQEWGFTNPVLIDPEGEIIAGHGRVRAAQRLELPECPVIVAQGWTETQKRAYVIADNKIALNASWDQARLAGELEALAATDFELELVGFSAQEMIDLSAALEPPPPPAEKRGKAARRADEGAAALPERSTTRRGDVWILGRHRVICGNPLQFETLHALMQGDMAALVFTACDRDEDDPAGLVASIETNSHGWVFLWIDWRDLGRWLEGTRELGGPTSMIVWHKGGATLGDMKRTFSSDFELGLVWHRGAQLQGRRVGSVWKVDKDAAAELAKSKARPVGLAVQAIERTTTAAAIVLDLAGRDGATLVACEKTGRAARVVEIDPRYVDLMLQRWQDLTGTPARLAASGAPWGEVADARRADSGVFP
jgi:hypothetical protein